MPALRRLLLLCFCQCCFLAVAIAVAVVIVVFVASLEGFCRGPILRSASLRRHSWTGQPVQFAGGP
eukprot:11877029-Alexandrium_andersonii.AAC.1